MILTLDLLAALSHLTDNEREILIDRVLLGHSQTEISMRLRCTRRTVETTERLAIRKMRALLNPQRIHLNELLEAA